MNTNVGISRISLRGDAVALVDDDDWFLALEHDWFRDDNGYAAMIREGHIERMHRIIVDAQPGELVDHINGDRLDNRRANLRVCSNRENQRNRPKPKTTAKVASRFKGVSWDKCNRTWRAKIVVDGRQLHLGTFADETEAAAAYDQAARIHFGDFAWTNSEQK